MLKRHYYADLPSNWNFWFRAPNHAKRGLRRQELSDEGEGLSIQYRRRMRHVHLVGDGDVANGTHLRVILTDSRERGQSAYSQQEKKNRRPEENRVVSASAGGAFWSDHDRFQPQYPGGAMSQY
jgi:hypothetical protein